MAAFQRRRQRQQLRQRFKVGSVLVGAGALGGAYGAGWLSWPGGAEAAPSHAAIHAQFSLCFTGGGYSCVVDGDTIWLKGEKIRIADIDAPETHDPRCPSEKELGDRSTLRLQQLLDSGGVTQRPIDRDRDRYGRLLRLVLVDGHNVGDTLVSEGLARWYKGGRKPWC